MKNPLPRNDMPFRFLSLGAIVCASALIGCEKKAPPPPPPVVTSTEPAQPEWFIEDLDMDARVQFPQGKAPSSQDLAQAVANLASAIASGDHSSMQSLLDVADREVLKDLVGSGDWKSATSGIEAVRVCVLTESEDKKTATVGLGVQDKDGAFMLAWTADSPGSWRFRGMSILPMMADRVAMLDDRELLEPPFDITTAIAAKPEDRPREDEQTEPEPAPFDDMPIGAPSDSPFDKPVG